MNKHAIAETARWLQNSRFWVIWYTDADHEETDHMSETMHYFFEISRV